MNTKTEKQDSDEFLQSIGSVATFECPLTGRVTFQDLVDDEMWISTDRKTLIEIKQ